MQPRCRMRVPVVYPASIQSDTEGGEGVLLDLSPAGCRMHSNIALNAANGQSTAIRTTGNVTLHADSSGKSITEAAGSIISELRSGVSSVQSGRPRTSHKSYPGSTTNRDTCRSCSCDSDAERRGLIIVFASKNPGHSGTPPSREATSLLAHVLLVSLTFLQTRRRPVRKNRPPCFKRAVPV